MELSRASGSPASLISTSPEPFVFPVAGIPSAWEPLYSSRSVIACGKSKDRAHELASLIWLVVINNLEENYQTFLLLKRLSLDGDKYVIIGRWPIMLRSCCILYGKDEEGYFVMKGTQKVFLPYPCSGFYKVEWKIFERLVTDFRDCLADADYYHLLACAIWLEFCTFIVDVDGIDHTTTL